MREGDVIAIKEEFYKYGTGNLKLRVTAVRRELLPAYQFKWVWLNGHEVYWDGSESRQELSFLVDVRGLPGGAP